MCEEVEVQSNFCPYTIPTVNDIIKRIDSAIYRIGKYQLITDVLECGAISIANTVDLANRAEREEQYRKGGDVFLMFDSGTLKVINGKIIEQEEKRIYHYKRKEPYSGWSMVLYAEVSYENGLFEIHLMIDNKDKKGQSNYWYLTVQGTSILECKGGYLSYIPDFVKIEYKD